MSTDLYAFSISNLVVPRRLNNLLKLLATSTQAAAEEERPLATGRVHR
jgi:hypothetical protein